MSKFGNKRISARGGGGGGGVAFGLSSRGQLPSDDAAVSAASLRSVLASMSDEELLRYKSAFQHADADSDGLLDVGEAMKALQSVGVPVTSGAMLDTLDEIEVAQEDSLRSSEWEQEQGRRRRRRRRDSLEHIETEQLTRSASLGRDDPQHDSHHDEADEHYSQQQQQQHNAASSSSSSGGGVLSHLRRGRRNLQADLLPELDRAGSHSSLRSPSIDISTFLNLLNRRDPQQQQQISAAFVGPMRNNNGGGGGGGSGNGGSGSGGGAVNAAYKPSPILAGGRGPSSRNPLASPPHLLLQQALQQSQQQQQQQQGWERQGYQASSTAADSSSSGGGAAQPPRSFAHVTSGATMGSSASTTTGSPRLFPSLRLRDRAPSEVRLHSFAGPLERSGSAGGGGIGGAGGGHPSSATGILGVVSGGSGGVMGTPLRSAMKPSSGAAASGVLDDDDDDEFNPESDLLAAFHTFDPSHSGSMSVPHLQAILTLMGDRWSNEEAQEMIEEVDARGEGRFNYRQLVHRLMARE
jgi:Ca2+-binding EF-hand superfamily protein